MKKLCFLIVIFPLLIHAQEEAANEAGAWYILSTNTFLTDQLSLQAQTQLRFYELAEELQQFKIRAGLTYDFGKGVSASAGYAFFRTDPSYATSADPYFTEQRIYEDIELKSKLGKLGINHRYQIEHRFFSFERGNAIQHWARYLLKLTYPITKAWSLDLSNEVFVNFQKPTFGQNWLGAGLSYAISKQMKTRVGYLNFYTDAGTFHRILLGVYIATDWKALKKTKPY